LFGGIITLINNNSHMDHSWKELVTKVGRPIGYAAAAALVMLTVFLLVATIDGLHNWGHDDSNASQDTITVTGDGMATAIPDTATVSFSSSATAADVATAESKMTTMTNTALDAIKAAGISTDDITTTSYNVSPHYASTACPVGIYCPQNTIKSGYDVSESVQVKIHDTSKVATVLAGLAKAGVSDVSGPNFVVADTQAVMQQAREQAIAKAQADAKKLVTQLGVRLGKITYFQDNTNGSSDPQPTYKTDAASGAMSATPPTIPTGSNSYSDSVSITYEIH
jgi:uncharacterized protein YggE